MLVALQPTGTIYNNGDFKLTMSHNISDHSIQSTKKMVSTIKKPSELMNNGQIGGGIVGTVAMIGSNNQQGKGTKKNMQNSMQQNSQASNYASPYNAKINIS